MIKARATTLSPSSDSLRRGTSSDADTDHTDRDDKVPLYDDEVPITDEGQDSMRSAVRCVMCRSITSSTVHLSYMRLIMSGGYDVLLPCRCGR